MAKQWKQSLEQSDILSDGTPFDGANIDAPISSAGQGTEWGSKIPGEFAVSGSSTTVSGSGYLISIFVNNPSNEVEHTITIDGSDVQNNRKLGGSSGANSGFYFWRFDSSLKVEEIQDNAFLVVNYVLD